MEAVEGMAEMPFNMGVAHYDPPPPEVLDDVESPSRHLGDEVEGAACPGECQGQVSGPGIVHEQMVPGRREARRERDAALSRDRG